MGVETTKGRRSRGVRSRILLTAISWPFLHRYISSPSLTGGFHRPGWKDSRGPQVTRRGGVASRASPQQDWLAKSRKEVEAFGKDKVSKWAEAVLKEGKVRDELIQQTVTTLQQQGVTGRSLLELTPEELMTCSVRLGPAKLLAEKIRLLQEVELPRFSAPYFNQPEVALALVLCSAVRWPAEGHQLVPGTSLRWSDIFRAGAAFPNNKSVLVPRLWWCEDTNIKEAIRNDLKELNIDLEGLLPDSLQLATERGEKWEELVANSLAARFRLHCIARNLSAEVTWVPFLEIYPTEDPHLRAVLEPFEVCWSDGVEYPSGQGNEATVMSDVGKAIKSNRNFATAHHDLLIPVRCKATGKLEFIAAQCCYGEKKDAGGLKLQDKAKKGNFEDMQNVLLQICSESEGWQSFTNKTWARRQEEKKYSLMSCETIIAQLDVLKLL
ncbi:unnamed protein product [Effrenium voratum]|uniref:Uncharacterized protein n=1 Tax=Effrenium voratum TaxID=2562239 RepID=A0AA36IAJ3_9DINO|nr:unnamed protein product [Effrenium voratum]CAJ1448343.1 unnamed protein product [Effrenium voratum]